MAIFSGKAFDPIEEKEHLYPKSNKAKAEVLVKYDFIFSKLGIWIYLASSDDQELFTSEKYKLHEQVETAGEQWRIVDASTGEIIKEGGKQNLN